MKRRRGLKERHAGKFLAKSKAGGHWTDLRYRSKCNIHKTFRLRHIFPDLSTSV